MLIGPQDDKKFAGRPLRTGEFGQSELDLSLSSIRDSNQVRDALVNHLAAQLLQGVPSALCGPFCNRLERLVRDYPDGARTLAHEVLPPTAAGLDRMPRVAYWLDSIVRDLSRNGTTGGHNGTAELAASLYLAADGFKSPAAPSSREFSKSMVRCIAASAPTELNAPASALKSQSADERGRALSLIESLAAMDPLEPAARKVHLGCATTLALDSVARLESASTEERFKAAKLLMSFRIDFLKFIGREGALELFESENPRLAAIGLVYFAALEERLPLLVKRLGALPKGKEIYDVKSADLGPTVQRWIDELVEHFADPKEEGSTRVAAGLAVQVFPRQIAAKAPLFRRVAQERAGRRDIAVLANGLLGKLKGV